MVGYLYVQQSLSDLYRARSSSLAPRRPPPIQDEEDSTFVRCIQESENQELSLTLYNSMTRQLRDIVARPRLGWGGQGLLGTTIRFDTAHDAHENVLHVVDVVPGALAAVAGLRAATDYIIGGQSYVFRSMGDFETVVTHNLASKKPCLLHVYDSNTEQVREVTIEPPAGADAASVR